MSEKTYLLGLSVILGGLGVAAWKMRASTPAAPPATPPSLVPPPSALAKWPLVGATRQVGPNGVTRLSLSKGEVTDIDFVEFDFKANPKLRLELFAQEPLVQFNFGYNAAALLFRQSDARGQVLAACNGRDFDEAAAKELPIVNQGRVYFVAERQPLWTLGVRKSGTPRFELVWQASKSDLNRFLYATGGVQCLVKEGVPLNINEPTPSGSFEQNKAQTRADIGNLGAADWVKTSRLSLGWNRDGSKLWMLSFHVAQEEVLSRKALAARLQGQGTAGYAQSGWTARDVQDFWKSQGAPNAVLLAKGDHTQFASRRPDGKTIFVPAISEMLPIANGGGLSASVGTSVVRHIPAGPPPVLPRVPPPPKLPAPTPTPSIKVRHSPGGGTDYIPAAPYASNGPIVRERPSAYSRLIAAPREFNHASNGAVSFYWMVREAK